MAGGAFGERRHDDRERGGGEHRAAETLDRAGGGQLGGVLREAAEQAGDREQHQAADEDPAAAEQVGEAPAEQQEAGERQDVCVDDPLQARLVSSAGRGRCEGSATFTIETSRTTMNCATHATARISASDV